MAEEEIVEEAPSEQKEEQPDIQPSKMIEQARTTIAELDKQNERLEKNIKELSKIEAHRIMSGTAEAGNSPLKSQDISDAEYAKLALKGEIWKHPKT